MSPGWGWTPPSGGGTPPVSLNPADGLQDVVDALAAAGVGGIIELGVGTYYADPANPATVLTIPAGAYDICIRGTGNANTIIGCPILCQAMHVRLEEFHCDPPAGSTYGIKIYNGGSPFMSRCRLDRVNIGDRAQVYTDGPTNGLVLDGVGVFQAVGCTFAFCADNGMLCDSTGVEPNTTLQFDMCSFVGNGGHGAKLMGSITICEFRGGNAEQNGRGGVASSCEIYAESMNNLRISNFDFETNNVIDNQLFVTGCSPVIVEGCNFLTGSGKATRGFIAFGSTDVRLFGNRFVGYGAVGCMRISDDCTRAHVHGNTMASTGGNFPWLEDYSR